jgi:RNA polymerase sigma-70 factor, ECF subfamily
VTGCPLHENINRKTDEGTLRLENWMRLYGSDVLHLAYSYVRNYHLAEDLTQDVFLRALTKMESFRGQSSVRTWLLSITANRCKDYLRSWSAKHEVADSEPMEKSISNQDIASEVEQKLEQDKLWQAVAKLPVKYREVVILSYKRDLSGQETAEVLGLSEQTVRTRLYRARGMLKDILEKEGIWNGQLG